MAIVFRDQFSDGMGAKGRPPVTFVAVSFRQSHIDSVHIYDVINLHTFLCACPILCHFEDVYSWARREESSSPMVR